MECEECGDECFPRAYEFKGKKLCLDCFLWYSNGHMIDPIQEVLE
jgi:hypothetical protein